MNRIVVICLVVAFLLIPIIGVSCDSNGDGNEDSNIDNTAPAISGITVSDITRTTTTISWTTDEPATSNIEYGPDTSYGSSYPSPSDTTADETTHSLTLSGLSPGTNYHCRVKSADALSNEVLSEDITFATVSSDEDRNGTADNTAPVISDVTVSSITITTATISWTTDEATTGQIEYGITTSYGSSTALDTNLVNTHSVNLTGLTAKTNYHYRIRSKDAAGNEAISVDYSFNSLADIDMGKIVFSSNRDGNQEIYIMNGDGTNQIRLTNNSAIDSNPQLSADGRKIVFDSDRDGNREIYVMNVDGSDQMRLTNSVFDDKHPSWSPDGTKIVFDSGSADVYDNDHQPQIWIMESNGVNPIQLTYNNEAILPEGVFIYTAVEPVFSPDGTSITFSGISSGTTQATRASIWTMNTNGGNKAKLVYFGQMGTGGGEADWSPNSNRIVFTRTGPIGDSSRICVANSDGTNEVDLTDYSIFLYMNNIYMHNNSPSYSPDGSKIVFCSNRDFDNEIYVMNADGSSQTRLTNNTADDSFPSWGPTAVNDPGDTIVTFPDANLDGTIRAATGKLQGDIYQSDLAGLTRLDATIRDIANLAGLEYCSSLIILDLGKNPLTDLSPLSSLNGLTWLGLWGNQISDLSPLSSLTNLTRLYLGMTQLGGNQISDIAPLVSNSGLGQGDTVYLEANPLSSTSANTYIPTLQARGVAVYY